MEPVDISTICDTMRKLTKEDVVDPTQQREVYTAAMALATKMEQRFDTLNRIYLSFGTLATAKVLTDLKVFQALASDTNKIWETKELATHCGSETQLLHRLLRYQAAAGNIEESAPGKFTASHTTSLLALPGTEAAINHHFLTISNNLMHLPKFLADTGYKDPVDPKHTPAHLAFNHEGDLSTWFATHPTHAAAAFRYFSTQRADQRGCFIDSPLGTYALSSHDQEAGRILMCDIGGGAGHQCLALRSQRPELRGRLVVTDLDVMIQQQDRALLEKNQITSVADDFFSLDSCPNALQHAKTYYLRNVLHDWDDNKSIQILSRVRKAMATDSVLVLDELVLPEWKASMTACNFDLSMMTISSWERSSGQWQDLLERAGFEIEQTWCYDEDRCDCLIFAKAN